MGPHRVGHDWSDLAAAAAMGPDAMVFIFWMLSFKFNLSHYQHPPPKRFVCYKWPILTHQKHPPSIVYIRVHSWHCTLWVSTSVQWYVSITMTCIHHYSIVQNKFTVLKVLCALLIYPPDPWTLANTDLFTVPIILHQPINEFMLFHILISI